MNSVKIALKERDDQAYAGMFLGENVQSQQAIQTLFERARTWAPCVIFFDEVDGLIGSSSEEEAERLFRDQFLAELDRRDVHVIAATLKPELIDPLFMQKGRFDKLLYVPLPSPDERAAILRVITRNSPLDPNVDLDLIAKKAEGFNGFDLCRLVEKAAEKAEEEAMKGTFSRN